MTITTNRQAMEAFNTAYRDVVESLAAKSYADADAAIWRLHSVARNISAYVEETIAYATKLAVEAKEKQR